MGDLSSRRGRIGAWNIAPVAGDQGHRSLAEMFGYATHMRSSTQGRAEYSMHFARYEEVPRGVADEIIAGPRETSRRYAGEAPAPRLVSEHSFSHAMG